MLKSVKPNLSIKNHHFIDADQYQHLKDEQLIGMILSGEKQLFEVIMRRYNQRLYRIQRSYIADEESIKDTLQTTYIKIFEHLHSFRGEAKFSTWITRIAINEALKFLQKEKRITKLHLLQEERLMNEDQKKSFKTPEEITIQKDYKKVLEQVVEDLPPKYRSVYMMREVEHMDTAETARCLNITASNVKVRLHRAKNMIQDIITDKFSHTEIFDFLGERCDLVVFNVMKEINS